MSASSIDGDAGPSPALDLPAFVHIDMGAGAFLVRFHACEPHFILEFKLRYL